MKSLLIVLTLGIVLLSACSPAAPAAEAPAGEAALPYPPPTATPPTPEAYLPPGEAPASGGPRGELPAGAVAMFSKSGGIAGVNEQTVIFSDGRISAQDGVTRQVPALAVTGLLAGLEQAGVFSSSGYSSPPGACADCFTYTLIVQKDGQTFTFQAQDGDSKLPQPVQQALALVQEFLK